MIIYCNEKDNIDYELFDILPVYGRIRTL